MTVCHEPPCVGQNTRSSALWYVYVTCVTIIRNHMLERLLCVYRLVAAVTALLGSSLNLTSASTASCTFRATVSPLQVSVAM